MGYALRWALGHAAALGVIAAAVLGLGATGLVEWTSYAELLVCLALLLIGGNALRTLVTASRAPRRCAYARATPPALPHGVPHARAAIGPHRSVPWGAARQRRVRRGARAAAARAVS